MCSLFLLQNNAVGLHEGEGIKKKKTAMFYGCLNLEQRKGNGKQILNKMPSV